jgi:cyanophycin synthetase
MRVVDIRAFDGRNVFSHRPAVAITLDLGPLARSTTAHLDGFAPALLGALPSLAAHRCALGRPGGFVTRLNEGTLLGHVVEHVALELQTLAGSPVSFGKTRQADAPGAYLVVIECPSSEVGLYAGRAAVDLVEALAAGQTRWDVDGTVKELRRLAAAAALGPSTAAIRDAALARGIPVTRLSGGSLLMLGMGVHQRRVQATLTDRTSCVAADIAGDKALAKQLLAAAGIPVPEGFVVTSAEEAVAVAQALGAAVAIKPFDGNQGKGVTLSLSEPGEVRAAFDLARAYSVKVIVERFVPGRHFRVLVVGDEAVAAAERIPARVVGDGRRSVRELIEAANADPRRGRGHEKQLTRIHVDAVVHVVLARQNMTLDYVPPPGVVVFLRQNANLSTGGTSVDATDELHPANAALAVRAARVVGLDVAGIDIVTPSIAVPVRQAGGAVVEVNAAPGIRMHHYPESGRPSDAAGAIVRHLFPAGAPARVPVVAITGTNGKTTTARLVAHVLARHGLCVGLATTDGVSIGGEAILDGDYAGAQGARAVLQDRAVEAAVLETARGGIIRHGLGFDWCDVGAVLNVAGDHVGQDNVRSLEDLAHVKSLVVETVKGGGFAVLNADDPLVAAMAGRGRGTPVYFSLNGGGAQPGSLVGRHTARGGMALLAVNGDLVVRDAGDEFALVAAANVPLTYGGHCRANVANVLAAAAICLALSIPRHEVADALCAFDPDAGNPGRFNVYRVGAVTVLVDYGHNVAAWAEAADFARLLAGGGRVVAVVGVPGDRSDDAIVAAGRMAAGRFDRLFLKEDVDRRGRPPGAVAALLRRGAEEAGLPAGMPASRSPGVEEVKPAKGVEEASHDAEALERALKEAQPGDTIVVFYDKHQAVGESLQRLGAVPVGAACAAALANGTPPARLIEVLTQPVVTGETRAGAPAAAPP